MGLTSYCLLLATGGTSVLQECTESLSDQPSILCNTVVPWLFPPPASQVSTVLEQHSFSSMQKKYFCAGLLVVSCVLYYSSYLELYEVLSMRSSARADVLQNSDKWDEVVKIFYYVNVWSHMKESFLWFCGSLFLM